MGHHLTLLLVLSGSLALAFHNSRFMVLRRGIGRTKELWSAVEKNWWDDDEESEDIVHLSDENKACMQGGDLNLFDQLPNRPNWFGNLGNDKSTVAMQTLREISESYLLLD